MSKLKVLFFAADPLSADGRRRRLLLDEEARRIEEEVIAAIHGERVDVRPCLATRIKDLYRALNRFRPDVVHFSGHGGEDGLVLVASSGRGPQYADAAALGQFFEAYRGQIRVVVLNACHSRPQARAIAQAVGCAIGTPSAIQDEAAIHFSTAFYSSIASGNSVQTAFDQARATLKMEDFPDGEAPVLEHRPDVDPGKLVLIEPVVPAVRTPETPPAPKFTPRTARRTAWAAVAVLSTAGLYYELRPDPACAPAREVQRAVMAAGASSPSRLGLLQAPADSTDPMAGPRELVLARRLHQAGNHDADLPLFRQAAEAGNPEAMTWLGLAHLRGLGTPVQPDSGVHWLRQAAEKGDARGMTELGNAYLKGEGVTRNLDYLAKRWFEKAADLEYAEAMRNLGHLYREGRGVDKPDGARALEWYVKAAKAGFVDAMVDAGWMYEQGMGVPRDARQAFCWYRAAAEAGSARGKVVMGEVDESARPSEADGE